MNNLGKRVPADFPSDAEQHREDISAPFLRHVVRLEQSWLAPFEWDAELGM